MGGVDFQDFTEKLWQRLLQPLPGEAAHARMASGRRRLLNLHPNDRTRQSAVLIVFYPGKQTLQVPLILRPAYEGVHGGQVAFPGGRAERVDRDLTATALREAQEEIGIKSSDVRVLGLLTRLYIPPSNFWVQPVIGVLPYRPDFYPDPREVEAVLEVSLTDFVQEIKVEERHYQGVAFEAPYYEIQGHRVWGATAMMLAELLELLPT